MILVIEGAIVAIGGVVLVIIYVIFISAIVNHGRRPERHLEDQIIIRERRPNDSYESLNNNIGVALNN